MQHKNALLIRFSYRATTHRKRINVVRLIRIKTVRTV